MTVIFLDTNFCTSKVPSQLLNIKCMKISVIDAFFNQVKGDCFIFGHKFLYIESVLFQSINIKCIKISVMDAFWIMAKVSALFLDTNFCTSKVSSFNQ